MLTKGNVILKLGGLVGRRVGIVPSSVLGFTSYDRPESTQGLGHLDLIPTVDANVIVRSITLPMAVGGQGGLGQD